MKKPPIKHNPAFLTDQELKEAFVVRHDDLNLIVTVIRENTGGSNQHVLVIGPRGIGKTMLVRRVALEVRRDDELREKWYPLIFAEESYKVGTAGEFWLESLFHLGSQTGDARWMSTYDDLKREPVEDRLRERALAQLIDFADSQGKRILLIVENLNMLLNDQVNEEHAWKLRGTLMHEPRLMLLATSITRIDLPEHTGKAMFELFKTHVLKPLDDKECQEVWRSITGKELGARRIRAVSILTGGNPRLLAIISHFGASLSFTELMQEMMHLVDDHTDYFKSQLDALPSTERKVYVALADLWDPSTAREVASASRLDVSMTSSLLKRLSGRGAVTEIPGKTRTRHYQVAERMYNIYYLMRRRGAPSDRVKALVQFMVQFYEKTELVEVARCLTEEQYAEAEAAYRKAIELDPKHLCPRIQLFELIMKNLKEPDRAIEFARNSLKDIPDNTFLLNHFAWCIFESGPPQYLTYAEECARKAVALDSLPEFYHALACVLAREGNKDEALQFTSKLLDEPEFVGMHVEDMVILFKELVKAGCAGEAFRFLRDSNSAIVLEPIAVALRMHLGMDVHAAPEIFEVVKDVLQRFKN
jgi:tetratricopeptide (TPR) repeat protein